MTTEATIPSTSDRFQTAVARSTETLRRGGATAAEAVRDRGGKAWENVAAGGRAIGRQSAKGLRAAGERLSPAVSRLRPAMGRLGEKTGKVAVGLFHALGLPHLEDVKQLRERVEAISAQVDRLAGAQGASAAKAPAGPVLYHVQAVEGGWAILTEGAAKAESVHGTKKEALEAARAMARAALPSRLVIHRQDGSVQDEVTYEAD